MVARGRKTVARNDLDGLSYKQLMDLRDRVDKALSSKRDDEKADAKAALAELAEKRGFSLDELMGARRAKGNKVAVKYVNPDNRSETWTGRGRTPRWLAAKLSKGAKREHFEV